MAKDGNLYFCEKCGKSMRADQFYGSNNTEKYPDKKLKQCKQCLTMHVDNWDPNTYLWILQECDVPYIPDEWNRTLASYGKDPENVKGTTIIGRYLSKMKIKQYRDFRWKDNEFIQNQLDNKTKETMERQGYSKEEIATAIQTGRIPIPTGPLKEPVYDDVPANNNNNNNNNNNFSNNIDDYFDSDISDAVNESLISDLTDEDKRYLCLKWGKSYKPEEWVRLEKLYEEMNKSYDIQTAGHEDTLKLVCKTSLKANQLLDIGDVDGSQKMTKMYNELMKSGKFENKSGL